MSKKVIDILNAGRARELSAILQYMAQHYELEDQQYDKLAEKMKKVGIEEMKHAEALAERILFLNGEPSSKPDAIPKKGEAIPAMLKTDMVLEEQAIKMYNDGVAFCLAEKDDISRQLFEKLLADEEKHFDDFDNIRDHVEKLGAAYLATLTGE